MSRGFRILRLVTLLAGVLAATCPASGALLSLGGQVNDDPANMIDPSQDAGLVDAAGGTVVAGNKAVPWATFEQKVGRSQQIFEQKDAVGIRPLQIVYIDDDWFSFGQLRQNLSECAEGAASQSKQIDRLRFLRARIKHCIDLKHHRKHARERGPISRHQIFRFRATQSRQMFAQ